MSHPPLRSTATHFAHLTFGTIPVFRSKSRGVLHRLTFNTTLFFSVCESRDVQNSPTFDFYDSDFCTQQPGPTTPFRIASLSARTRSTMNLLERTSAPISTSIFGQVAENGRKNINRGKSETLHQRELEFSQIAIWQKHVNSEHLAVYTWTTYPMPRMVLMNLPEAPIRFRKFDMCDFTVFSSGSPPDSLMICRISSCRNTRPARRAMR